MGSPGTTGCTETIATSVKATWEKALATNCVNGPKRSVEQCCAGGSVEAANAYCWDSTHSHRGFVQLRDGRFANNCNNQESSVTDNPSHANDRRLLSRRVTDTGMDTGMDTGTKRRGLFGGGYSNYNNNYEMTDKCKRLPPRCIYAGYAPMADGTYVDTTAYLIQRVTCPEQKLSKRDEGEMRES